MATTPRTPVSYYQVEITLKNSPYPCKRTLIVTGGTTLYKFAMAILGAMGWEGYHLWDFECNNVRFSQPSELDIEKVEGVRKNNVSTLLKLGTEATFTYDFGDSWEHELIFEKYTGKRVKKTPALIAGEGACPPEDCGGVWGLADLIEILKNPKHPEYEDMKEWAGDFDYTDFDLAKQQALMLAFYDTPMERSLF